MNVPTLSRFVSLLCALEIFSLAPMAPASAALSHEALIQRTFKVLKLLPEHASPASRVAALVTKLAALNPRRAFIYYKVALLKLASGIDPSGMAQRVISIVKKSDLPPSQINSIAKTIKNPTPIVEWPPPSGP